MKEVLLDRPGCSPVTVRGTEEAGVFLIDGVALMMKETCESVTITNSGESRRVRENQSREGVGCHEIFHRPPSLRLEGGVWLGETSMRETIDGYHQTDWIDYFCEIRLYPEEMRGELKRRTVKDVSS